MTFKLDAATLTHAARRLGLPGWAGLALLAFAAWGEWVSAPAIVRETTRLQSQVRALRHDAARTDDVRPEDRPRVLLAALYARLAEPAARVPALERVIKQAQTQGLAVDAVHFHTQDDKLDGVVRHEVSLPVKGTYAALRGWLAQSLAEQPALSLDALQIKRTQAQDDSVEARVTLSLWVNRPLRLRLSQLSQRSQRAAASGVQP